MRYVVAVLMLALVLTVSGCAGPQPRKTEFIQSEYDGYWEPGTATIRGQAFLRTRGGEVRYAAGTTIYLNPVTTYSTEWFNRAIINGENLEQPDPRAQPYARMAIGDGEGRFEFTNIPKGRYYIAAPIYWEYKEYAQTGASAYAQVEVKEGQTVNVIVTR